MNMTEFFKGIVDTEEGPIGICDTDYKILYLNPTAMTHYKKADAMVGKHLEVFLDEEMMSKVKNELTEILNSNKSVSNIVNYEDFINSYLENVSLNYFDVLKEIISYFYIEKILYSEFDKKIIYLLNSNNNSNNRIII